jgi:O-antigen ligase
VHFQADAAIMSQTFADATSASESKVASRARLPVIVAVCAAALVFGLLLPIAPLTAVLVLVVIPLALLAPFASLSVLIAGTVLVPFEVQDSFAVIGGRDQPGLLFVDAVMLLSLCRLAWLMVRRRVPIDAALLAGIAVGVICAAALAFGIAHGAEVSEAGHEARRMALGVGAFLMAWPLMRDRRTRRRLVWLLLAVGLALGLWGLAQWMFSVEYTTSADIGVRPGVDLTSAGRGQLQGGMFAYPVAVTLAWAALVSGRARTVPVRWLLALVICLNGLCLLLTFERTLWAGAALACLVVTVASGPAARRLAIRLAVTALAIMIAIAAVAPGEARTAVERLLSVARVSTDESYTYRVIESRAVAELIAQRPITGSGFGATITWEEEDVFAKITTPFVHNGYLWLAWKIGIPATLFLVVLLSSAVLRRTPSGDNRDWRTLRRGSQAALLALLLISVMFAAFDVLGITATMGLLVAICHSPADDEPEEPG